MTAAGDLIMTEPRALKNSAQKLYCNTAVRTII